VDYTTIDVALIRLGAVSVPLQAGASVAQLRPIVAKTEPAVIASSIDYLSDAVELTLTGHTPTRLVVFDYHPASTTSARPWTPLEPGWPRRPVR
jgi:fatty acid CoA ligase FadD9